MQIGEAMKENDIVHISETILFGEKSDDHSDYYMDLLEGAGNDFTGTVLFRYSPLAPPAYG